MHTLKTLLVGLFLMMAALAHAHTPQYRHYAFITNTTYTISASSETNPNPSSTVIGGLSSADLQVTRRANAAGFLKGWDGSERIYKAVVATNTSDAFSRIDLLGPIYNTNFDLLADDADQFWYGTLNTGINYNEFGTKLNDNTPFWTGCNDSGFASQNCLNWSQTASQFSNVGYSNATTSWNQAQLACNSPRRLAGISPAILQGDFDEDNDVDGQDFLIWQRYFGTDTASLPQAERHFPNRIRMAGGLEAWQENYGVVVEPLAASTAVPEPNSMLLLFVAGTFAMLIRRGR